MNGNGLVTVVGVGSAEIQADKAADTSYSAASANYILNSVAANIPANIWVGTNDTEINFPASTAGLDFYRSTEPNCV